MGRRKINLPLTKELTAEYESGMTQAQLAEKYDCSISTISTRLRVSPKINLPVDQVISDYESGMTLKALTEKYGSTYFMVRNLLVESGFKSVREEIQSTFPLIRSF